MKKLLFISFLFLASTEARANINCGFKPFPPAGCYNAQPACQCDRYNNCHWIFLGC